MGRRDQRLIRLSQGGMTVNGVAGKRVVSPALIGRSAELERLVSVVAAFPAVVVIEGEAGIGKTRLVSELRARPELGDRKFLLGSCRRIRESFPLGPIVDALRVQGDELAATSLSPVAGALRPLLPELAHRLPPPPPPLDDRAAERHRMFRGLIDVLDALGPAVLVLEDLHWVDDQTVDFVSYLLGDMPPKLAVVLTFRSDEVDPAVRALTVNLPSRTTRTDVVVAPLGSSQAGALAAAILGVDRVSEEFAAYLCARSSGLPFAIEELLALLQGRGTLVHHAGDWARRALDELDVPTGIRDTVLERVSRVSPDARSLLEAAAVLQAPVSVAVLATASRSPSAISALDEALESGLLAEHGETVGFRHLLAAQAVYEGIPGPRGRELHSLAATTLETLRPVPLGQVAHHLRHAGRLDEWVIAAERAADQAIELGHDTEAVRLLEDVLRYAPLDCDRRGRVAVKLGRAALETLHGPAVVIGLLSEVVEQDLQDLPRGVRGELRFVMGLLLEQVGRDPVLQRRLYAEALEELDDRPDLKAWATMGLGNPIVAGIPVSEHKRWLDRSLEILPTVADPAFEVFVLGKVAMVLVLIGDPAWRRLTQRIQDQTGGTPQKRLEVNAYWSVGMVACHAGDYAIADGFLTAGLEGAIGCENRRLELFIRCGGALFDYCRGSWDGLGDRVEDLLFAATDYPRALIRVEVPAGCLAIAHGDLDAAQALLADVVERVEPLGDYGLLPLAEAGLARLNLARGDPHAAAAVVHRFLAFMEPKCVLAPFARALPVVTQTLIAAGERDEARRLAARWEGDLQDWDAPLTPAALRHARGHLEAAAERWSGAARHFLAAADLYERLLCPYEAAQANEEAGLCLFADGDERAEPTLRAALTTYERLGATWDSARVTSLARRHGVSLPARHRGGHQGYGTALSPREREVAELAARGRTNKDIARELFLSPKTVDKHVTAALHKLGLHSRTALAHHFAETQPVSPVKNGAFTP